MELREWLAVLRRRALFISIVTVLVLAFAWVSTPRDAHYRAESVLYVGSRQIADPNQQIRSDPLFAAERLTRTFAVMIDSSPIAQDAIELTGIRRSAGAVVAQTSVAAEPNTQLLRVTVTDPSPVVARDLANGMAHAFVERVQQYEPGAEAAPGDVPALPAYVFAEAALPVRPEPSGLRRNLMIGGLFGLLGSAGIVLLRDHLDVTVKGAGDAERRLELPVLGAIPLERDGPAIAPGAPTIARRGSELGRV